MNCFLDAKLFAGWPSTGTNTTPQLCVLVRFQQDPIFFFFFRAQVRIGHLLRQRTRSPSCHCSSLKTKQNLLKEQVWKSHNKSLVLKIEPAQQPLNQPPTCSSQKKTKISYCLWGHSGDWPWKILNRNRVATRGLVRILEIVKSDSSASVCKLRVLHWHILLCFVFPPHQSLHIISVRLSYPFFFLEVVCFVKFNILISFWIISCLGGQKISTKICWLVEFSGQRF